MSTVTPSSLDWSRERGAMLQIVMLVLASILVIAVVAQKFTGAAVPGMMKARVSTNEASALAALRVINAAEAAYSSTCTTGGFAVSLEDLAKPPHGQDVPFVSSDLGKNGIDKSGYRFTVERDAKPAVVELGTTEATCNGAGSSPASSYFASAWPAVPGTSGVRYFATDARGIVYVSDSAIENPIVESDHVKPVEAPSQFEKLGMPQPAAPDAKATDETGENK